jgi:hypothetical protein
MGWGETPEAPRRPIVNLPQHLSEQTRIRPPHWLVANTCYPTLIGSIAYGVADTKDESVQSDFDLYGLSRSACGDGNWESW